MNAQKVSYLSGEVFYVYNEDGEQIATVLNGEIVNGDDFTDNGKAEIFSAVDAAKQN